MTDPHGGILKIDFTDVDVLIAHVNIGDEDTDLTLATATLILGCHSLNFYPRIVQDLERSGRQDALTLVPRNHSIAWREKENFITYIGKILPISTRAYFYGLINCIKFYKYMRIFFTVCRIYGE